MIYTSHLLSEINFINSNACRYNQGYAPSFLLFSSVQAHLYFRVIGCAFVKPVTTKHSKRQLKLGRKFMPTVLNGRRIKMATAHMGTHQARIYGH